MKLKIVRITFIVLVGFLLTMGVISMIGDRTYTYTPLFDEMMPENTVKNFMVAPTETALTFARYESEAGIQVLLVHRYTADWIEGVNLNDALQTPETDVLVLFETEGYDRLAKLNHTVALVRIASENVVIPIDTGERHIAMGGNYLEHGQEVAIETPWIFPKIVQPTPAFADVPWNTTMLDPAVEMGLVLLNDLRKEDGFPEYMGIILVNDFSDRKRLVQYTNPNSDDPCAGCTEGKSQAMYLPIGNLLVVPKDFETFYPQIELRLYVNNALRQKAYTSELTLNPRQIVNTIWENAEALYDYQGGKTSLLANPDLIEKGTIILTGTPAGVVFSPPTFRQIMSGIPGYILSFNWSNRSPLDGYFRGAEEARLFLQKGDQVISSANYLGILDQRIRDDLK